MSPLFILDRSVITSEDTHKENIQQFFKRALKEKNKMVTCQITFQND